MKQREVIEQSIDALQLDNPNTFVYIEDFKPEWDTWAIAEHACHVLKELNEFIVILQARGTILSDVVIEISERHIPTKFSFYDLLRS